MSSDVQFKWIGKPQRDTGNQLLSVALRDRENFNCVYVSPDLTKAERVQQYNLRLQKRQLEGQNPANIYKNLLWPCTTTELTTEKMLFSNFGPLS